MEPFSACSAYWSISGVDGWNTDEDEEEAAGAAGAFVPRGRSSELRTMTIVRPAGPTFFCAPA